MAGLLEGVQHIVEGLRRDSPGLERTALLEEAIQANIRQAVADLLEASAPIRERVRAGTLKVVGAHYGIDSGLVEWMGERVEDR